MALTDKLNIPTSWAGGSDGGSGDHLTLLLLVVVEAIFVGWLRLGPFKRNFGG